VQDWLALPP